MPETDYVLVWDSQLKRTYPQVRSAAEADIASGAEVEILEGNDALDAGGQPVAPEFDLARKPASKSQSGPAATPEKEKKDA